MRGALSGRHVSGHGQRSNQRLLKHGSVVAFCETWNDRKTALGMPYQGESCTLSSLELRPYFGMITMHQHEVAPQNLRQLTSQNRAGTARWSNPFSSWSAVKCGFANTTNQTLFVPRFRDRSWIRSLCFLRTPYPGRWGSTAAQPPDVIASSWS